MKTKKTSFFQRILMRYRLWKSNRNMKILNKMVVFSMFDAIRLANRKRDILNHTTWVVAGGGEFLVFCRYQKQGLQAKELLKPNLTGKELNEIASYIALPYTSKDHRRGGIIKKFLQAK